MLKHLAMLSLLTVAVAPLPGWASTSSGNGSGKANSDSQDKNAVTRPSVAVTNPAQPPKDTKHATEVGSQESEYSVTLTTVPPLTIRDRQKTFLDHVYDWGPWFFSFFLAIAGAVQLWLLKVTWRAIREQKAEASIQTGILRDSVAAAQKSADASMAQIEIVKSKERAQLRIEFEEPNLVYVERFGGYPISFSVILDGLTRANIIDDYIVAYLADSTGAKRKPWESLELPRVFSPDLSPFRNSTLLRTDEEIFETGPNPERIELVRERKLDVYVHGRIRYRDIFGDKWMLHIDRFWNPWSFSRPEGTSTGVWVPVEDGRWDFHRKEEKHEQPQNPN